MQGATPQLSAVNSTDDYVGALEGMASASRRYTQGRPTELKTYMIESRDGVPGEFSIGSTKCKTSETGLDGVKILRVGGSRPVEFYLDINDGRFLFLHTNYNTIYANHTIEQLVNAFEHAFDRTWLYSGLLKKIPDACRCKSSGFGIKYSNYLSRDIESDPDDMSLDVGGSLAEKIRGWMAAEAGVKNALAYDVIKISRGSDASPEEHIRVNVHKTGHLAVKSGRSIKEYLDIIKTISEMYAAAVENIEKCRIGVDSDGAFTGHAVNFTFPNGIGNPDLFVDRMFNGAKPFKMWGIKEKVSDGYYIIEGVDIHTGARINFEVSSDMMRAYLYRGGGGSTVLRLLANLQMQYDSDTYCRELDDA